jgi:2-phosphosulfolactate phosphatase
MSESRKRKVEVCFSPLLFPLFDTENTNVIVVDVLRATSAICAAFANGVEEIIPVPNVYEALEYKEKGWYAAAERNGNVVPGFDFGNSPYAFMKEDLKGKGIVLTTTNGTKAIDIAKDHSKRVFIGSFVNLTALANHLATLEEDVLILCAGWKDRYCMEDSIFGGAMVDLLMDNGFITDCDSAKSTKKMWKAANNDLMTYLSDCSHRLRLGTKNLDKDIEFCLSIDTSTIIPWLDGKSIKKLNV